MKIIYTVVVAALIVQSQCQDDLDMLIREIFDQEEKEESRHVKQAEETILRSSECICVPYYLCANKTIISDGVGLIDIRVKQKDCPNYLDVCCEKPLDVTQKITPEPMVRGGCGRRNPEGIGFRIMGDEAGETQFGEFPWIIAVLHEEVTSDGTHDSYQCGGTLIHPEVVITAAHCVTNKQKKFKIRAGEWDTQTKDELFSHQEVGVKRIVIHPEFHKGALYNDVALLFLDGAVTLADNIDTICLPRQGQTFDYGSCIASGWGKDFFGKQGKDQVILKKVDLPLVPRRDCERALRRTRLGQYFNLHSSFVCAGGEAGKDTCKGDGGSPLVCPINNSKNKFVQVGIVSWGIGCGENGTPGVYANVASFRDWIDDQIRSSSEQILETKYYEY